MNVIAIFGGIFIALFGAICVGSGLRSRLREHHLSTETKETVRLAMGLVSTMAALLLGLLVSAASGSYRDANDAVEELSSRVVNLDSTLQLYGPEAVEARKDIRVASEDVVNHIWAEESNVSNRMAPRIALGDRAYKSIMKLVPGNEMQISLKGEALKDIYAAFEISSLLYTKSAPSVSPFLLAVVVGWLSVIFLSYSVFAPRNGLAFVAMAASALSVIGALVLIWELDRPFDGIMPVSSEPMRIAIAGVGVGDPETPPATP